MTVNATCERSVSTSTPMQRILRISDCKSEAELTRALSDVISSTGFDYFQYVGDFMLDRHGSIRKSLSNFPTEWVARYTASRYESVDPAFRHALTHVTPAIWSSVCVREVSAEQQEYLSDARNHEIGDGVSFPIQTKNGDNAILSFANHISRSDTDEIVVRTLAEGSLTAAYAHDAMRRIVDKERNVLQAPLTSRELECLRWIAVGKSNWEIAMIFGMTEHGVVYYVRKLLWKLSVHNRHHAVARATAYGLL